MCLLVLAWQTHPRYELVVAANRDEYHARPAAPLAKWPPPNDILAGRDLQAGGTWLGLDRQRRFGVVTNFRDLQQRPPGAASRGDLVPAFLGGGARPGDFLAALGANAGSYAGFNLLLAAAGELWYASNRAQPFATRLAPGVYGLSNHYLDTPWPKLSRVRARFEEWLREPESARDPTAALLELLADRQPAALEAATEQDALLPQELQRALAAPFVLHPQYGTRCSTVLLLSRTGQVVLTERSFDPCGRQTAQTEFRLNENDWP